ncbi:MAG: hypothetical protein WA057_02135 [Candidatus Magasanikiibacteriota bacterium]
MRRFILTFSLLLLFVIITSGCTTNPNLQPKEGNNNLQPTTGRNDSNFASSTDSFLKNSVTSTAEDLLIDKEIMVMGKTNTDGTINALQIIIGQFPTSSFGFGSERPSSTRQFNNQNNPEQNSGGQRPDRGNFIGERPSGGQNGSGGQFRARETGVSRINGKIIKKDDTSLVIQVRDGGSKIIFYSSNTKIFTLNMSPVMSTSTIAS